MFSLLYNTLPTTQFPPPYRCSGAHAWGERQVISTQRYQLTSPLGRAGEKPLINQSINFPLMYRILSIFQAILSETEPLKPDLNINICVNSLLSCDFIENGIKTKGDLCSPLVLKLAHFG